MLFADVSNAGFVMLTSQCWDMNLIVKTHKKLASELPTGAVVIDYRPIAKSSSQRFRLLRKVQVPVSWNPGPGVSKSENCKINPKKPSLHIVGISLLFF